MNSAELPHNSPIPTETSRWDDVRRIYRRVCLLRATGRSDEAADLQNAEFLRALLIARTAAEAGVIEAAVLAEEAERVSAACLLAELVAPMIAAQLRGESASAEVVATAVVTPTQVPVFAAPTSPRERPTAGVPGIADLIDGMLSQENAFSGSRARS